MKLIVSVIFCIPALVGLWLMTLCRTVITGPESSYETCSGPGAGITEAMLTGFGCIGLGFTATLLTIQYSLFFWKQRHN